MEKRIIPCLCLTCGVRNDFSHPNGFCQNGHDDWLEYRDLLPNDENFVRARKLTGLGYGDFVTKFMDPDNKLIEIKNPDKCQ